MESLSLEEENIIKDIRSFSELKRVPNYIANKDVRNIFRIEKETKAIKYRILRDIENLFLYKRTKLL